MGKNCFTKEENDLITKTFDDYYRVCDFEFKIAQVLAIIKNTRARNGEDLNVEYKEIFIKRIGLMKQIIDEAFPIANLCNLFFNYEKDKVYVKYVLGNQQYDAIIKDERFIKQNVEHIEITLVEENSPDINEYSIRNCLNESPNGKIGFTSKNSEVMDLFEKNFIRALKKKLEKSKTYPNNTALVIYVKSFIYNKDKISWDFLDEIKIQEKSSLEIFSKVLVFDDKKILHTIYER